VTIVTFSFETSPNAKPTIKSGGTWHSMSPPSKKVGGTRPPCLPPNCAHADIQYQGLLLDKKICQFTCCING